jgi:opacity protein-like surface antigen
VPIIRCNFRFWLLTATILSLTGQSAAAQEAATPSGHLSASVQFNEYYTDNVLYSRPHWDGPRQEDWVSVITPSLNYRYETGDSRLNIGASAEIGRFMDHQSENYEDARLYVNGRHKLDPMTVVVWGASMVRDHEARASFDPADIIAPNPTIYWNYSGYGAVARRVGDETFKLGATFERYVFENDAGIINDVRDRNMMTLGGRWTHRLDETSSFYVDNTLDLRRYDNGLRDSQGLRSALGWQKRVGTTVDLDLYGGLIYQAFDTSGFDDVVALDFGGQLSWRPLAGSSVTIDGKRSVEETTLAGTSSYLRTYFSLEVQQAISEEFRVYGGGSVALLDFENIPRADQVTSAWLGFRRYVTPNLYVGGEAAYEERESNDPANDYTEARVMARVGLVSDDGYDEADLASGPKPGEPMVYVGVRGGVSSLMTMLDGLRQPGQNGSLTADFGDFGLSGDVFAGIGVDIGRWYVGLEADGSLSNAEWDHARAPGGREFSVQRTFAIGGSVLFGARVAGGALLYGRAGVRGDSFKTKYVTVGSSSAGEAMQRGFEYGVGARVPVSDRFSVGMEYVHTVFNDYGMGPSGDPPDQFSNLESTARIAATYQFSPIPGAGDDSIKRDFSGGYLGVQVGHGGISSRTQGDRDAGSVLTADFGDTGITGGVLAGYKWQTGDLVLGAEVDGELAQQEWNHARQPSGRTYSVEKAGSASASLLGGVVLGDVALAYGRIGVTGTSFDMDFSNPGGTAQKTEWRAGVRYGLGLEVPVTDDFTMRFDYTFTDYGTLKLQTKPGPETYDTSESLFRLGAIFKI